MFDFFKKIKKRLKPKPREIKILQEDPNPMPKEPELKPGYIQMALRMDKHYDMFKK